MARPRTDIQPRILHAARARFLVDGVEGASLRRIAKDARTNIGMVFYYYPTKDELFLAVIEEVYAKLLSSLEHVLASDKPVRDRLAAAFERIGAATDEEIDIVRLVMREALVFSDRFRAVLARFKSGHIAMMFKTLSDAVESGELDDRYPVPLLMLSTFGIGGVPQLIRRVAGPALPFPLPSSKALARTSIDILFDGAGQRSRAQRKPVMRKRKPAG
jgi:AcrR family transcriptional regulator